MQHPMPRGAWDTHQHIFEPKHFAYSEARLATHGEATLTSLEEFEKALGIEHICIAHSMAFGSDVNSLVHYLHHFRGKARGTAIIELDASTEFLYSLHQIGVRSVRIDFRRYDASGNSQKQIEVIKAFSSKVKVLGWSITIQHPVSIWTVLRPIVRQLEVRVIIDHMGLIEARSLHPDCEDNTMDQPGMQDLLGALRDGNLYIKVSAPYRVSADAPYYRDLAEVVKAFASANEDRILWASDWPHTTGTPPGKSRFDIVPFHQVDTHAWLISLSQWLSSSQWYKMLVTNPRCLFDYPDDDTEESSLYD